MKMFAHQVSSLLGKFLSLQPQLVAYSALALFFLGYTGSPWEPKWTSRKTNEPTYLGPSNKHDRYQRCHHNLLQKHEQEDCGGKWFLWVEATPQFNGESNYSGVSVDYVLCTVILLIISCDFSCILCGCQDLTIVVTILFHARVILVFFFRFDKYICLSTAQLPIVSVFV